MLAVPVGGKGLAGLTPGDGRGGMALAGPGRRRPARRCWASRRPRGTEVTRTDRRTRSGRGGLSGAVRLTSAEHENSVHRLHQHRHRAGRAVPLRVADHCIQRPIRSRVGLSVGRPSMAVRRQARTASRERGHTPVPDGRLAANDLRHRPDPVDSRTVGRRVPGDDLYRRPRLVQPFHPRMRASRIRSPRDVQSMDHLVRDAQETCGV